MSNQYIPQVVEGTDLELGKQVKAKSELFRSCVSRQNVGVLAGTTQRAEMDTHPLAKNGKEVSQEEWSEMEEVQGPIVLQEPREEVISGRMMWPAVPEPADQN